MGVISSFVNVSTFPYPSRFTFQWLYETEGENSTVPEGTVRYAFSCVAIVVARAWSGSPSVAAIPSVASAETNHRLFMAWLLLVIGSR